MRVKLLTLSFSPSLGGFDERPLSDFVRDKELLAVREHFFQVNDLPHLACLVMYQETRMPAMGPQPDDGTPDERPRGRRRRSSASEALEGLTGPDRAMFETLREWRAATARQEGVPPYVILTNRQILGLLEHRPESRNALLQVEGIGPAKVKRYGDRILEKLHGSNSEQDAPRTKHQAPEPSEVPSEAAEVPGGGAP